MDFINIDREKCLHDGICTRVCVHEVIQFNKSEQIPVAVEGNEQNCVTCGHCVSICPSGAFSHSKMPVEQCVELKENWRLTDVQLDQLLKGRRSTRNYKKKIVDRNIISQIINAAKYAPTGYNMQPVKWMVLYDAEEVKEITVLIVDWMKKCMENNHPLVGFLKMPKLVAGWERGEDLICYNAPHLILTYAPKQLPISQSSCLMSLTYLEMAALPFGLGTCWAGFVQIAASMSPEFNERLGIPEGDQCFGSMMLGYPQYEFHRIPVRREAQIIWK